MYSKKQILLTKQKGNRWIVGIYFLIFENEIVYIGRSKNVYGRVYSHKMQFDFFAVIECKELFFAALELYYIIKFKPRYNKNSNSQLWIKKAKSSGITTLEAVENNLTMNAVH